MTQPWSLPAVLALVYLTGHLLIVLLASRRLPSKHRLLAMDLALGLFFLALLWGAASYAENQAWGVLFARLWAPILFFWWAYTWAGQVLHAFHPPEFSVDRRIMGWEAKLFRQPSLWLALGRPRWLTELMHFFYASYYLYTPVLGIYLHAHKRFNEFEAMSSAVLIGYAASYLIFSLIPLWGPRWGLLETGQLDPSAQVLKGYWLTNQMNRVMYGGPAHKGGAMPSSHSSTAVVFLIWSWRLWGAEGGALAAVLVAGMWIGSVYGRYHYVIDLLAGAMLGLLGVWAADWVYRR